MLKKQKENELFSNNNKKVCTTLNYTERILDLVFAVTACNSISALASLITIFKGIMSSTVGLNICAIIARIKKHKSIIKKKKRKRYEIPLLVKKIFRLHKRLNFLFFK